MSNAITKKQAAAIAEMTLANGIFFKWSEITSTMITAGNHGNEEYKKARKTELFWACEAVKHARLAKLDPAQVVENADYHVKLNAN